MAFIDIFIGVPQSKIASIAILVTLAVIMVSVLFGKEPIPFGQKFVFVILLGVLALPSVLLSLFQLTCIVTGAGAANQRWWCAAYAWIIAAFTVFYGAIVVVLGIAAMFGSGSKNLTESSEEKIEHESKKMKADDEAKEYFEIVRKQKQPSVKEEHAVVAETVPEAVPVAPEVPTDTAKVVEQPEPSPFVAPSVENFVCADSGYLLA